MKYPAVSLLLLALFPAACAPAHSQGARTEVAILGAIHGGHLDSSRYSVEVVIATVRRYKPDVVFVEIPPDLFEESVARIDSRGFATTKADLAGLDWTPAFPELYRGVIPLRKEMGFAVVPVSGWTRGVSAARRAFWEGPGKKPPFADRRRVYDSFRKELGEIQDRERWLENPRFLNSPHYADLRRLERTLWSVSFDEGLGAGGEKAINRAHYGNIARALDQNRGRRVLIVYGAAHRYWFERELRKRADIDWLDIPDYLPK